MWPMRPDKVKTITSVMKPLLGRGDNEMIFSENLVSINHVEHHCGPPHCSACTISSAHSSRQGLVGQDWLWSSESEVCRKCVSAPTRRVLCWSWRSNQSNVTLPTQVKMPYILHCREERSSTFEVGKLTQNEWSLSFIAVPLKIIAQSKVECDSN